jgi:hypothetical protein
MRSHLFRASCLRGGGLGLILCALLAPLLPLNAAAVTVGAGRTRSDVGLHNKLAGVYLGVANEVALTNPILDVSYALEYVQKKGSQPTPFADPIDGFTTADAEVTLHVLEPSLFVGAKVPGLPVVPRVYVGGSIGLKVKESWSEFPGVPDQAYGYKETDVIVHFGTSFGVGPARLDLRWSKSLVGQLLNDTQERPLKAADKAEDPLAGITVPQVGYKTEVLRIGAMFTF